MIFTSSSVVSRVAPFLWGLTLAALVGLAAPAQATVPVTSSPLIIQPTLPPNLMLMLDDSGSMAWDYMPDLCYLQGVRCGSRTTINNAAMIDAANNGLYYNPTVRYDPPPRADGSSYPVATGLTSAWLNGFTGGATVDLTTYHGASDSGAVDYSTTRTVSANGLVTPYAFFQYSLGPASGPYTIQLVAATDCGGQTNCVLESDTSGVAAPAGVAAGQNIANWFAYSHTRLLMAQSGLMEAMAGLDPSFRFGFGSINGNNADALPQPTASYNGKALATVHPFGDGTAGTRKAQFWQWLAAASAESSTPLRAALDAVGQYYRSSQPWQTSASDSQELACRQSYTILTTDGFWNGSLSNLPGNADGIAGPAIQGPNGQSSTYANRAPYADSVSNTLADVAMRYWKNDLRPTLANEVPTNNADPAFWQHMATFTLGLGFAPTGLSPSGTTVDQVFDWARGGPAIANFAWPTPSSDSVYNIADLAHAAVNGHGGFYSAATPQAFLSGITGALARAAERVGTGASLAANATQIQSGAMAYQANYYTAQWKGDLKAIAIDPATGQLATSSTWTAASVLPAASKRVIHTYNPSASSATQRDVLFQSPGALSPAEQAALGSTATVQQAMINYLRGDPTNEQKNPGGTYRNRDTALGDIVNSQPVYVAGPLANQFVGQTFTGSADFPAYATDQATRSPEVWVAANDGFLHAFDAGTGVEAYAYLPAAVITSGVAQLADPAYGAAVPHQFFNDGELTVADAYLNGQWRTVAVGTTGRGPARAVYALDITDPTKIAWLWERSAQDGQPGSTYLGQMTGKPVIAQTADGQWSVLLGNGYNSTVGVAALLQFNLADGTLSIHPVADTTADNGLAAPGVWMDNPANGVSTRAYAGDLLGHVWSFVLNTGSAATTATPTSTGTLLYTAKDPAQGIQPITAGMLLGKDPTTGNVWVFFGTGRYLATADLTDLQTQTWYGLIVQSSDAALVQGLAQGRGNLVQRAITAETAGSLVPPVVSPARTLTAPPTTNDMAGKSGWFVDLLSPRPGSPTQEGERMVTPNQFQGNLLLGTSRIPQASDPCNPFGRGWVMALSPFTGTSPSAPFFDLNGDGVLNASDTVTGSDGTAQPAAGAGFNALPNNPIFVGGHMLVSFDNGTTGSFQTSGSTGDLTRVSWREWIHP